MRAWAGFMSLVALAATAPPVPTEAPPAPNGLDGQTLDAPRVVIDTTGYHIAQAPRAGGYVGPFMRPRSKRHRQSTAKHTSAAVRRHRKAHRKARRGVRNR